MARFWTVSFTVSDETSQSDCVRYVAHALRKAIIVQESIVKKSLEEKATLRQMRRMLKSIR